MDEELIPENDLIVRYLFHELSGPEVEEFQRRMVLDDDLFERLQCLETHLIHSFVRDEMTAAEQARFRKNFLPFRQNQEKVREARLFHEALRSIQAERSQVRGPVESVERWFIYRLRTSRALAFASLSLIVLLALGIVFWARRLPPSNQQNVVITNQTTPDQASPPLQIAAKVDSTPSPDSNQESSIQPKLRGSVPSRKSAQIQVVNVGSGRATTKTMGPPAETIIDNPKSKPLLRFRLFLGNDRYDKYLVTIEDDLGEIEDLRNLEAKRMKRFIIVDILASYFKEGHSYRFILMENKGRPYKMVVKRNPPRSTR